MTITRELRSAVAALVVSACARGDSPGTRSESAAAAPPQPPVLTDSGAMTPPVVGVPDPSPPPRSSELPQSRQGRASPVPKPPVPPPAGEPRAPAATPGKGTSDQSQIARLETEARALAKSAGCENSGQCRTAPVGSRACGGPRLYLTYCSLTTDSAALFRKLRELERAEQKYNMEHGMASTCEMRMPPDVALVGGSCRAVSSSPGGPERMP